MNLTWYERAYAKYGDTPAGSGYNGLDQVNQYRILPKLTGIVVDLGCGWGPGGYYGIDIHRKPLQHLRGRAACGDHRCIGKADWVLMMGIFSIGYTWREVVDVVTTVWSVVRRGIAITFVATPTSDLKITAFHGIDWHILLSSLDDRYTLCDGWDDHLVAAIARKP